MTIPLPLQTERLSIRAFDAADVDAMAALAAAFWGRGSALEAAHACVDAAFAHLPDRGLVAKVEVGNERSVRLAERLGMRRVGTISVDGHPHALLAPDRP